MIEQFFKHQRRLIISFVDFKKALDSIYMENIQVKQCSTVIHKHLHSDVYQFQLLYKDSHQHYFSLQHHLWSTTGLHSITFSVHCYHGLCNALDSEISGFWYTMERLMSYWSELCRWHCTAIPLNQMNAAHEKQFVNGKWERQIEDQCQEHKKMKVYKPEEWWANWGRRHPQIPRQHSGK